MGGWVWPRETKACVTIALFLSKVLPTPVRLLLKSMQQWTCIITNFLMSGPIIQMSEQKLNCPENCLLKLWNYFEHCWPHPLINEVSIVSTLGRQVPTQTTKKTFNARNGGPTMWEECFQSPFMHRLRQITHSMPTRPFKCWAQSYAIYILWLHPPPVQS